MPLLSTPATSDPDTQASPRMMRRRSSLVRKVRKQRRPSHDGDVHHDAAHVVSMRGYLLKKGTTAVWKKRFFYLQTHYISYSANEAKLESLGGIDLRGAKSTIELIANGTQLRIAGLCADVSNDGMERDVRVVVLRPCTKGDVKAGLIQQWCAVLLEAQHGMREQETTAAGSAGHVQPPLSTSAIAGEALATRTTASPEPSADAPVPDSVVINRHDTAAVTSSTMHVADTLFVPAASAGAALREVGALAPVDDWRKIRAIFQHADRNHNGVISVREMMLALRHDDELAALLHLPSHIHQEDGSRAAFERVFAVFDEGETREITFEEFLAHIMDWSDNRPKRGEGRASEAATPPAQSRVVAEPVPRLRVEDGSARVDSAVEVTDDPVLLSTSAFRSLDGRHAALQPLASSAARRRTVPHDVSCPPAPPASIPLPPAKENEVGDAAAVDAHAATLGKLAALRGEHAAALAAAGDHAAVLVKENEALRFTHAAELEASTDRKEMVRSVERTRYVTKPDSVVNALRRRKNELTDADTKATAQMRAADALRVGAPQAHATPARITLERMLASGASEEVVATRLLEALEAAPAALAEMEARAVRAESDRNKAVLLRVQLEAAQPRVHITVLTDSSTSAEIARLRGRTPSARVTFCTARVQGLRQQLAASSAAVAVLRKLEDEALLDDLSAGSPRASTLSAFRCVCVTYPLHFMRILLTI